MPWWRKQAPASQGRNPALPRPLTPAELTRLAALGVRPADLAARLRLVLPVGCARDFTQTRSILRTGSAEDQIEAAIQTLIEHGAHCDCEVFRALGEPPRCVLWHQSET